VLGGSSSAVSDALTCSAEPGRRVAPEDRLLSAAALRLSKHDVVSALATASPDGAPAGVARRDGVAVLAPAELCNVRRSNVAAAGDREAARCAG
jgi:hypothetical protein